MAHFYARNLAKSYKRRKVVSSVDLDVESGQVVGLLGPNGAGKTTTFYMMTGLVKTMPATSISTTGKSVNCPSTNVPNSASVTFRKRHPFSES